MVERPVSPDAARVLVVLGAKLGPDGAAGPALMRRVAHAGVLWAAGAAEAVIVTGGPEGAVPTEARVMRDALVALGVPEHAVIEESRARDTLENAAFSITLLRARGLGPALVVTDRYHLPRALIAFRLLGMAATGSGSKWGAPVSRLRRIGAVLRECVAIPVTAARALWSHRLP